MCEKVIASLYILFLKTDIRYIRYQGGVLIGLIFSSEQHRYTPMAYCQAVCTSIKESLSILNSMKTPTQRPRGNKYSVYYWPPEHILGQSALAYWLVWAKMPSITAFASTVKHHPAYLQNPGDAHPIRPRVLQGTYITGTGKGPPHSGERGGRRDFLELSGKQDHSLTTQY